MPAENTEIDAHKSHVRRRITCEYLAFPDGKHDDQIDRPVSELAYQIRGYKYVYLILLSKPRAA
jgi:phage terminase large subunit-like protein